MNTTEVNPILTIIFTILVMIFALFGIGDIEFGPFSQGLL